MELFLLLIPAIILPVGLSIAGIWWLLGGDDEEDQDIVMNDEDDEFDGGF